MDAGSDHGSTAKRLAIDLEVAGSGTVELLFFFFLLFFIMCSSLPCLSVHLYYYLVLLWTSLIVKCIAFIKH